jgi:hypothetical protein
MTESFKQYKVLSEYYINSISGLIDFANSINIIPIKYSIFINKIKNYIIENKMEMIKNGLQYILNNKSDILNISLDTLKSKDNDDVLNFFEKFDDAPETFNIIFEILNNSKKLKKKEFEIVKEYLETIIIILEKIKEVLNK